MSVRELLEAGERLGYEGDELRQLSRNSKLWLGQKEKRLGKQKEKLEMLRGRLRKELGLLRKE